MYERQRRALNSGRNIRILHRGSASGRRTEDYDGRRDRLLSFWSGESGFGKLCGNKGSEDTEQPPSGAKCLQIQISKMVAAELARRRFEDSCGEMGRDRDAAEHATAANYRSPAPVRREGGALESLGSNQFSPCSDGVDEGGGGTLPRKPLALHAEQPSQPGASADRRRRPGR